MNKKPDTFERAGKCTVITERDVRNLKQPGGGGGGGGGGKMVINRRYLEKKNPYQLPA